jgi:2',3'-cyclic-nucleotide 2'-phosphodiesterase (5'-nucleotidase family)
MLFATLIGQGCGSAQTNTALAKPPTATASNTIRVSLLGTNDLHGHIAALPLYAGYVANLRAEAARTGDAVVLADAGDMFQGTLESNMVEGASVVRAYAALGMHAVTVGNHEFDFGPVGLLSTPANGEDARGALKAAAAAAPFPFLLSNVLENGKAPNWPNFPRRYSTIVGGIRVGFIGVTTHETLSTTLHGNVTDLTIEPLALAVRREAALLRDTDKCAVVVLLAHAGGKCQRFTNNPSADACEPGSEIFKLAKELGAGSVDAVVAGHTHAGLAHEIEGIPIIESYSYGTAFGRVDFSIDKTTQRILSHQVLPPQQLCTGGHQSDPVTCTPHAYAGALVTRDPAVESIVAADLARAAQRKSELLGTVLPTGLHRDYDDESAMGNAFTDLILAGTQGAQVAILNGGGLRANLPKGPLNYGALFEAFPFDNRLTLITTNYGHLRKLLVAHARGRGGIFSLAGITVEYTCEGNKLDAKLHIVGGSEPEDSAEVVVATSDFLALGGDDFWGVEKGRATVIVTDKLMRDVLETQLRMRPTLLEESFLNRAAPRMRMPAGQKRPLRCKD